jgi:hypothetical protein
MPSYPNQPHNDGLHNPAVYYSKLFTAPKINYQIYNKDFATIIFVWHWPISLPQELDKNLANALDVVCEFFRQSPHTPIELNCFIIYPLNLLQSIVRRQTIIGNLCVTFF